MHNVATATFLLVQPLHDTAPFAIGITSTFGRSAGGDTWHLGVLALRSASLRSLLTVIKGLDLFGRSCESLQYEALAM